MFPCPSSRLRNWSRETGSGVSSRVSLLISILRLNLVSSANLITTMKVLGPCSQNSCLNDVTIVSPWLRGCSQGSDVLLFLSKVHGLVVYHFGDRVSPRLLYIFFFISLIADGPHHYHPACGHKGSSHLSPVHALQFFIAMQVQHSYNSSTNG